MATVHRGIAVGPEEGDIRVMKCLDRAGARVVEGRHTNLGYSGNILVFVWDGKCWAWLRNRDKPQDLPTRYGAQREGDPLLEETATYFERMNYAPEFRFWWYKGKRFAAIANKPGDLEEVVR
ncbi:MAG: hypothetical protein ABH864_02400 [archaeon]